MVLPNNRHDNDKLEITDIMILPTPVAICVPGPLVDATRETREKKSPRSTSSARKYVVGDMELAITHVQKLTTKVIADRALARVRFTALIRNVLCNVLNPVLLASKSVHGTASIKESATCLVLPRASVCLTTFAARRV